MPLQSKDGKLNVMAIYISAIETLKIPVLFPGQVGKQSKF